MNKSDMDEEKKQEAVETPEVPEAIPLTARLRAKLTELDAIHRERVGAVAKMEPKIRAATSALTELPLREAQLYHMRTEITRFLTELGEDLRHLDLSDQQLALQEQESQSRESIRREILAGLSLPGESIDDTFDVRTAEIRRRRALLAEQRQKVQADIAEGQRKMLEIDTITSPEKIAEARHELQRGLSALLEEQKALETLRRAALDQLTECQRMVDDMEERQLLIEYAQKVGLVLTSNSTDELIRVCRTHQEKIAAKNAAVDGDKPASTKKSRRRRTSRSTSSSDEDEVYLSVSGDCTCSRCVQPNTKSHYRLYEVERRNQGTTIAGAHNQRRQPTLRRQHGNDGWCNGW